MVVSVVKTGESKRKKNGRGRYSARLGRASHPYPNFGPIVHLAPGCFFSQAHQLLRSTARVEPSNVLLKKTLTFLSRPLAKG